MGAPLKFEYGRMVMTVGVKHARIPLNEIVDAVARHLKCDWGELCDDDKAANEAALEHGDMLLSKYTLRGVELFIITEADCSTTTVLLTSEY